MTPERRDHYAEITNLILTELEAGRRPWVRPWDENKAGGPMAPVNASTNKLYRGINTILLGMNPLSMGGDPRWVGFEQAKDKGWHVRKGEKSSRIIFFTMLEVNDAETGEKKERPILKAHSVFHASQVEGIPGYKQPTVEEAPWLRPEAAQIILKNSRARIETGGPRAFYSPSTDHIQLPPDSAFTGPREWSSTALHELGHNAGRQIMPHGCGKPFQCGPQSSRRSA